MKINYNKTIRRKGRRTLVSSIQLSGENAALRAWWKIHYPNITRAQHIKFAKEFKALSEKLSKQWMNAADKASVKEFGKHWEIFDYKVSGIGRDDFSQTTKEKLRSITRKESDARSKYYAHLGALQANDRLSISK